MKACVKESYNRGVVALPRLDVIKMENGVMPNQCRQCDDAPCAAVCPTGTLFNADGIVEVREKRCIGCSLCVSACPYGAIAIGAAEVPSTKSGFKASDICGDGLLSVAYKCDICAGKKGGGSACVESCPKGALVLLNPQNGNHIYGKKLKENDKMAQFVAAVLGQEMPSEPVATEISEMKDEVAK